MNIKAKLINTTNGYERDRQNVKRYLTLNELYTVERIEMHQTSTDIYLEGIDCVFNSVNFEFYKDGNVHNIFDDSTINRYLNLYM